MTSGISPQEVIEADDNGRLLLACRDGATRQSLAASDLAPLESQILSLRMIRLLDEDSEGVLRAVPPLLDPRSTGDLRDRTRLVARELAPALSPDVRAFVDRLAAAGRADNAYSILFSYVVDGLVWDLFELRGAVAPRKITAESPFWSGEVWAVTPARSDTSVGTNSISEGQVSVNVGWTMSALPVLQGFLFDWPTLESLIDTLAAGERVAVMPFRAKLEIFGIVDSAGRLTLPIIVEQEGDPLYDSSLAIANRLVDAALERLDADHLVDRFGFRDRSQALIVSYHELMWDVMDAWEEAGIVTPPRLFVSHEGASSADVADAVFAVVVGDL